MVRWNGTSVLGGEYGIPSESWNGNLPMKRRNESILCMRCISSTVLEVRHSSMLEAVTK